jgi:hypothetical protein
MYEVPVDPGDDDEGTLLKTVQLVNEQAQRQKFQQQPQQPIAQYSNIPQPIKSNFYLDSIILKKLKE